MSAPPPPEIATLQELESFFTTLLEPSLLTSTGASISPSVAAQRTVSYATDYIGAQKSVANGNNDDDGSTPGLQDFFWTLWSIVLDIALSKAKANQTLDERMTLITSFVSNVKETPQPTGQEWFLCREKTGFRELPTLGWCIRDLYNCKLSRSFIRIIC